MNSSPTIKKQIILGIIILLYCPVVSFAQYNFKIKPVHISINNIPPTSIKYRAFDFPLSKTVDFSNYPLTAGEIKRKEKGIAFFNAVTNYNRNGFINNYLGITRSQLVHPRPGF